MRSRLRAAVLAAGSSVVLFAASAGHGQESNPNAASQGPAASTGEIETVVVTARRREENAQNVPVAVTAFSSADIAAHSFSRPQDLEASVPSIYVFGQNRDDAEITMRGQSQGTINPGQRTVSGVQTYFDDVPTLISGPGVFYDLQSVQVLKGPQGTLFGRNTTGGAVLYQSALPADDFEASAKVSAGNYAMQEYEGMVNVPIVPDQLLLRVAGDLMRRDGFTTSVITGQDQDNVDYNAFRISLLWEPSAKFSNSLVISGRDTDNNGTSAILRQVNPSAVAGDFYSSSILEQALADQQAIGIRKDMIPFDTGYTEFARAVINTTTYDLNDDITIKNIFGYNEVADNLTNDFSATAFSIIDEIGAKDSTQQLSDEFQIHGTFDPTFNWIVGTYFEQAQPARDEILQYSTFGIPGTRNAGFMDHSYAGFAHFEKDMSSWIHGLTLSGGLRYTEDIRAARDVTTGLQAAPFTDERGKFEALTWDATADYHWNDEVMTYLAVRRGYKTGGFNLPVPPPPITPTFGPEHVIDLEVGLKGDWDIDGVPLRTNVAAFHDWYDNAQVEIPVGVGGVETATESTGRATIYGGEFEGTVVPVDGVTLSGFASIDHARFDDTCTLALEKAQTACGQFPFVPETKYGLSGQWELPIPDHFGTATLNVDYSWISKVLTSDKTAPLGSYPPYGLVNLRVDWQMFDWGVTASAFVTNLTDKAYIQGGYPLDSTVGFESVIYGAPRMFGFSVAYKFNND